MYLDHSIEPVRRAVAHIQGNGPAMFPVVPVLGRDFADSESCRSGFGGSLLRLGIGALAGERNVWWPPWAPCPAGPRARERPSRGESDIGSWNALTYRSKISDIHQRLPKWRPRCRSGFRVPEPICQPRFVCSAPTPVNHPCRTDTIDYGPFR
jgi:hypothetical protein